MDNTYLQEMVSRYGELFSNVIAENPMMDRNEVIARVNDHFDVEYHDDIELLAGDDQNLRNQYYYVFEDYAAINNGILIPYYENFNEMSKKEEMSVGNSVSDDAMQQLVIEEFFTENYLASVSDHDLMDPYECAQHFNHDGTMFDRYYNGKVMPLLQEMMDDTVAELNEIKENLEDTQTQEYTNQLPRIPLHAWGAYARALRDQKPETPEQEQAIWNQLVANNFGILTDKKISYNDCVKNANPIKVKKSLKEKLAEKFMESKVGKLVSKVASHLPVIGKKKRKKGNSDSNPVPEPTPEPIAAPPVDPLADLENNVHITKEAVDHLRVTDEKLNNYVTWYRNNKDLFLQSKKEVQEQIDLDDKKKSKLRADEAFYKKEINTYQKWMQVGINSIEAVINSPASLSKRKSGKKAANGESILVVMPTIDDKILDKAQYDQYLANGYTVVRKPMDMILKEAKAPQVVNQNNYISRLSSLQAVEREYAKLVESGEVLREDLNTLGKAEGIGRQEEAIQEAKAEQERKANEQAQRELIAKKEAAERAKAELEAQRKKDDLDFYKRQAERNYITPVHGGTDTALSLADQYEIYKEDKDAAIGIPIKTEEPFTQAQVNRIQRKLESKRTPTPEPIQSGDAFVQEADLVDNGMKISVETNASRDAEKEQTVVRPSVEQPIVEEPAVKVPVEESMEQQRNSWAAERLQAEKERRQANQVEEPIMEPKKFVSSHRSIEGTMGPVVQQTQEMGLGRSR